MSSQYYRVRVEWPIPHFMREYIEATAHVTSIYDSRFYTTATELRQVHLDIQEFLSRNYAATGLNEFEDLEDLPFKKSAEEILTLYGETQQPTGYKVEEINDPDQVDLITRALEQKELLNCLRNLIFTGFVPVKPGSGNTMYELARVIHDLDRAIAGVLRPFNYEEAFEVLTEIVDHSAKEIQTLRDYVQTLSIKP